MLCFKHKTLNSDILNYLKHEKNKNNSCNVNLKPPVGESKWLLISESLRFNRFIQTTDSFKNKAFDCVNEWITESFIQSIRSNDWFIQEQNIWLC